MTTITISLSDNELLKLKVKAGELGVSLEELIHIGIKGLTQSDEDFKKTLDYVIEKNDELYRRLASE